MYFSSNLRLLRKNNDMSQEELANVLGYSFRNISKWEKSLSIPTYEILIEISKIFNVTVKELMEEDLSKKNICKYKSNLIKNNDLNVEFQKEIFKFMYVDNTIINHKRIFVDKEIFFEGFSLNEKFKILLKKEKQDIQKLVYILDYTIEQLKLRGLILYYKIKIGDFIDIEYQI